jgi:hypothetical protein
MIDTPVSEVEIAHLLRMGEKATGRPWKPCTANDGACSCGLIWSVPTDVSVAITHAPEDDEEIHSEVNDNNRYIVASANLALRLAMQLREARAAIELLANAVDTELIETLDTSEVVHVHARDCPGFCDYACNDYRNKRVLTLVVEAVAASRGKESDGETG